MLMEGGTGGTRQADAVVTASQIAILRIDDDTGIRSFRSSVEIREFRRFELAPGLPRPLQPYLARSGTFAPGQRLDAHPVRIGVATS